MPALARRFAFAPKVRYRTRYVAKRVASAGRRAASSQKHRTTALIAAGLLGFAERSNVNLPAIDALGVAGTYGLGLALLAQQTRSAQMDHAATGLLCVALHQLAAGTTGTSGDFDAGALPFDAADDEAA